jgi:hypothetical protein
LDCDDQRGKGPVSFVSHNDKELGGFKGFVVENISNADTPPDSSLSGRLGDSQSVGRMGLSGCLQPHVAHCHAQESCSGLVMRWVLLQQHANECDDGTGGIGTGIAAFCPISAEMWPVGSAKSSDLHT